MPRKKTHRRRNEESSRRVSPTGELSDTQSDAPERTSHAFLQGQNPPGKLRCTVHIVLQVGSYCSLQIFSFITIL